MKHYCYHKIKIDQTDICEFSIGTFDTNVLVNIGQNLVLCHTKLSRIFQFSRLFLKNDIPFKFTFSYKVFKDKFRLHIR